MDDRVVDTPVAPQVQHFPCVVYETQKKMDDYQAPDMRYGDLSAHRLMTSYGLNDVSTLVDPYTLQQLPRNNFHVPLYQPLPKRVTLSRDECIRRMFNEMRSLSHMPFSLYGPYRYVINEMIDHLQNGHGQVFRSPLLNQAIKEQITQDSSEGNTLKRIKSVLNVSIDKQKKTVRTSIRARIKERISSGHLPKFDRFEDRANGLGITVHDTWATHITITSLVFNASSWKALVHYRIQDHFGLDDDDILNWEFRQWRFFRLWFVLQQYSAMAHRPFITEMETTMEIAGTL
ncbi:YPO3983 family protein [Pseudescherichia vulneris]|uniref:YPO3983 family protein n=1 Tax=Pseudescherichia vulneris TaxID=566 RepID=UPI0028D15DD2|nr:YPO3983 family protein [Pseudescherichia vulneris]